MDINTRLIPLKGKGWFLIKNCKIDWFEPFQFRALSCAFVRFRALILGSIACEKIRGFSYVQSSNLALGCSQTLECFVVCIAFCMVFAKFYSSLWRAKFRAFRALSCGFVRCCFSALLRSVVASLAKNCLFQPQAGAGFLPLKFSMFGCAALWFQAKLA